MAPYTHDDEIHCTVPAKKMFNAFILDGDKLLPKILGHIIKSVEKIHGDGGVGTVKLITFAEGTEYKSVKHRVDEIDEEHLTYKYSILEGDDFTDNIESISYEVHIVPTPEGGSICKNRSIYHLKGEFHHLEEHLKAGKEKAIGLFKAVEAHLHANPHEY